MKKRWIGWLASLCLLVGVANAAGVNEAWNDQVTLVAGDALSGVHADQLVFGTITDENAWHALNVGRDAKAAPVVAVDFKNEAIVYVLMHKNNHSFVRATSFKKQPDGWRLTVEAKVTNDEIAMLQYSIVFVRVKKRDVHQVSIANGATVLGLVDVR